MVVPLDSQLPPNSSCTWNCHLSSSPADGTRKNRKSTNASEGCILNLSRWQGTSSQINGMDKHLLSTHRTDKSNQSKAIQYDSLNLQTEQRTTTNTEDPTDCPREHLRELNIYTETFFEKLQSLELDEDEESESELVSIFCFGFLFRVPQAVAFPVDELLGINKGNQNWQRS